MFRFVGGVLIESGESALFSLSFFIVSLLKTVCAFSMCDILGFIITSHNLQQFRLFLSILQQFIRNAIIQMFSLKNIFLNLFDSLFSQLIICEL